jgi:hypothetical protein
MVLNSEIKVEKLVGAPKWAKWEWHRNMHFEQYDMMSIIDGSQKCPNITNTEKTLKGFLLVWKRDNAQMAVLITSVLSQPVVDLVLMYSDAQNIWDKLVIVYEQSSNQ